MWYLVNEGTKEHEVYVPTYVGRVSRRIVPPPSGFTVVQADEDGWIQWKGGECPLLDGQRFQMKFESPVAHNCCRASDYKWTHCGKGYDIIAYRPILEDSKGIDEMPCETVDQVWDGEGLPPVGTVCEMQHKNANRYERWEACTIIAYHEEWVVAALEGKAPTSKKATSWKLRPIRSEEDRAVDEMLAIAEKIIGGNNMEKRKMQALYRAGYRKTNTNEER